jgi:hypothetical protein
VEGDPIVEKGQVLEIKLPPNTFQSGQYTPINGAAIDDAIGQINSYVSKYPKNTTINVTIESSESKVPNSGVGLNPGDLSRLRAEEVQKYLNTKLPQNVKLTIDTKGAQGPKWDPKKGSRHSDYMVWQYVKLFASVSGEKETPVTTGNTKSPVCVFNESGKGGVANPKENFLGYSKSIDISSMPNGSKFKIVLQVANVPDMMVVKSGNQVINTGFIGQNSQYWTIILATILYHTYTKNGKLIPKMFPQNIKKIDNTDFLLTDGGLKDLLSHAIQINWSSNASRNVKRIESIGGFYEFTDWNGIINDKVRDDLFKGGWPVGVAQFTKDDTMKTVDIFVYSPIGTTIWTLKGTCM